eukprot:m.50690 g.50690  ORF g.50690 m.50690 type:complete len:636 (+) comp11610_c0_seq1:71-1978(+)
MAFGLQRLLQRATHTPRLVIMRFMATLDTCRGCGSKLQHSDPEAQGFLLKERVEKYEQELARYNNRQAEDQSALSTPPMLDKPDDGSHFAFLETDMLRLRPPTTLKLPIVPTCQRCFVLQHYGQTRESASFKIAPLIEQLPTDALIVCLVDVRDFPNSLHPELKSIREGHDVIVLANKVDILAAYRADHLRALKRWVREVGEPYGVKETDSVHVISARTGFDIVPFYNELLERCLPTKRPVCLIGCASTGKSTLINNLLNRTSGNQPATTSTWPGTTLARMTYTLSRKRGYPHLERATDPTAPLPPKAIHLFDTPGAIKPGQISQYLPLKDLNDVNPQQKIKFTSFDLKPGQSLLFGGLGRLDVEGDNPAQLTVYMPRTMKVHATRADRAAEVRERHGGTEMLMPPNDPETMKALPPLESTVFTVHSRSARRRSDDIVLGQLGFVAVRCAGTVTLRAWIPAGVGLYQRPSLVFNDPQAPRRGLAAPAHTENRKHSDDLDDNDEEKAPKANGDSAPKAQEVTAQSAASPASVSSKSEGARMGDRVDGRAGKEWKEKTSLKENASSDKFDPSASPSRSHAPAARSDTDAKSAVRRQGDSEQRDQGKSMRGWKEKKKSDAYKGRGRSLEADSDVFESK